MTNSFIPLEDLRRLGIRLIDSEHETIVHVVNELHAGMLAGIGRQAVTAVLEKLVSETQAHFLSEESLMVEHDYPHYVEHKSEHERLIEHLIDLERQFRQGKLLLSAVIMLDVKNWTTIHIERSDQPLALFLKARGVE